MCPVTNVLRAGILVTHPYVPGPLCFATGTPDRDPFRGARASVSCYWWRAGRLTWLLPGRHHHHTTSSVQSPARFVIFFLVGVAEVREDSCSRCSSASKRGMS